MPATLPGHTWHCLWESLPGEITLEVLLSWPCQDQWALHHSCQLTMFHLQRYSLLSCLICHASSRAQWERISPRFPSLVPWHTAHVLSGRFSAITSTLVSLPMLLFPGKARVGRRRGFEMLPYSSTFVRASHFQSSSLLMGSVMKGFSHP